MRNRISQIVSITVILNVRLYLYINKEENIDIRLASEQIDMGKSRGKDEIDPSFRYPPKIF
ncbi:MAG: hypothetical protein LUQ30_03535, partial [Methanothrix sp.]|nr:hypothetical protein [Methanothrix sp.]